VAKTYHFPKGFVWGGATASYQIEGAAFVDGRGLSIWDTFSHTPGKTLNGDTGDVACDHYHRWREDIQLMKELGLGAYRFSIAWPRVLPRGRGRVNEVGLAFYDRLVDGLLEAGITPYITLYHWDLPQALQNEGGWVNRATVDAFSEYTKVVADRLGDRVKHWITLNEPWVSAWVGHSEGRHAPGLKDRTAALQAAHHLLLAHGRAVPLLRAASGPKAEVGITLNVGPQYPVSLNPEDQQAAIYADGHLNRWFLDPLFGKGYPTDMQELYAKAGARPPVTQPADFSEIDAHLDFIGVNYCFPHFVYAAGIDDRQMGWAALSPEQHVANGREITEMGWPVVPTGFTDILTRIQRDYSPKTLYITENGCAMADELVDGAVDDPRRVAYYRRHLIAVRRAIDEGTPVKGFFAWSLMDNFEWGWGYSKRFGIVYVNYATQQRIPKASAHFYKQVIAANAVSE